MIFRNNIFPSLVLFYCLYCLCYLYYWQVYVYKESTSLLLTEWELLLELFSVWRFNNFSDPFNPGNLLYFLFPRLFNSRIIQTLPGIALQIRKHAKKIRSYNNMINHFTILLTWRYRLTHIKLYELAWVPSIACKLNFLCKRRSI